MNQQKYLLKKFRKKYVFLQNSLFDFLYWRSNGLIKAKKLSAFDRNKQFLPQKTSYFLEKERICFHDYWKSSEQKKIENLIQNMNKEFQSVRSSSNRAHSTPQFSTEKIEKWNTKDRNQSSQDFVEKTKFFRRVTKKMKFQTLKKKQKKFQNFEASHSNNETFIPKSDCFRRVTPVEIMGNHRIGDFFPRKKNFQQYWIFPLLGFVVLFSSNSSFLNLPKKENTNQSFSKSHSNLQTLPKAGNSFFEEFQSSSRKDSGSTKTLFSNAKKQKCFDSIEAFDFGFSYANKVSQESAKQFQKLERSEFQQFCDFSFKNFRNSISSTSINETTPFQMPKNPHIQFADKIHLKRTLETKRNAFKWTWFSVDSPYSALKQETKAFNSFIFEIPQKAGFFDLRNDEPFQRKNIVAHQLKQDQNSFKNKKSKKEFTPIFDFSRGLSLFNEAERNLSVPSVVFDSQKSNFLNFKNQNFSDHFLKNVAKMRQNRFDASFSNAINHSSSEIKEFLAFSQKHDFNVFNSFFLEKKNREFGNSSVQQSLNWIPNSVDEFNSFFLKNANVFPELEKKDSQTFKTFFFLQKWLQTQHFWKMKRKKTVEPFLQNVRISKKREHQKVFVENLLNLDSIYFHKLLKDGNVKTPLEKSQEFKNGRVFSNFSEWFRFNFPPPFSEHFQQNVDEILFCSNTENCFLNLKKRTFDFFLLQYYNKKYKNVVTFKLGSSQNDKASTRTFSKRSAPTFQLHHHLRKAFFSKHHHLKHTEKTQNNKTTGLKNSIKNWHFSNANVFHSTEKKIDQILQKGEFLPLLSRISAIDSSSFQNQVNLPNGFLKKHSIPSEKRRIIENHDEYFQKKSSNEFGLSPDKITQLKVPILLDFSNAKMSTDFSRFQNKEVEDFSFQFQSNDSYFHQLESSPSNLSSNYFRLTSIDRTKQFLGKIPSSTHFVLPSLQRNLKTNGNDFFLHFFKGNDERRERGKHESPTSHFFVAKKNFFEQICEKALKDLKTIPFFHLSSFEFFKKSFLVEKTKKQQALVFQNHSDFLDNFSFFFVKKRNGTSFQGQKRHEKWTDSNDFKERSVFSKFSKSFVLKSKQSEKVSLQSFFEQKSKKYEKTFGDVKSRKFEKVFQTFLSPLNKEKRLIFSSKASSGRKEEEIRANAEFLSKLKIQKDPLLLQLLSQNLKKTTKNATPILFLSPFKKKQAKTENFKSERKSLFSKEGKMKASKRFDIFDSKFGQGKFQSFESAFETNQGDPNSFVGNSNPKISRKFSVLQGQLKLSKTKNFLSPDIILKRDGFLFFSKSQVSSFIQNKKQNETSRFDPLQTHGIIADHNKNFSSKRLEAEKSFQKKRRLKKQKLETRRRKKRKRFFPRPVWLRFHLYKKFLKIRHPQKFFAFQAFNQRRKENVREKFLSLSNKPFKAIIVVFPKGAKKPSVQPGDFISEHQKISFENNSFFSKSKKISRAAFTFAFSAGEKKKLVKKMKTNSFRAKNFVDVSLKNQNEFGMNKIYRKKKQKWGFYWKNGLVEKISYRNFSRNSLLNKPSNLLMGLENGPISHNIEHYKISGEILSEFLRLSWKSYWFQTNFQPLTRRITQNFQKMQKIESEKNFSRYNLFSLLGNMKYPNLFGGFPTFENSFSLNSQNDLILRKAGFKKFLWYCNIQSSLESNSVQKNSSNFQKIQNLAEYNRIVYSRVSEVLKNLKSSENNDDFFFKNFKIPRRKNERIFLNPSIFTKSALFFDNFHVPSQPFIPAFSIFSSLFHDLSVKPTGELPTLRALWAFHRTNVYHFQEHNQVRNIWTLKKRTESFKSFKGTKKAVSFFRKYSGLESFGASNFLKKTLSKTTFEGFESGKSKNEGFQHRNVLRKENVSSKKILFLTTLKSSFSDYLQQLDTMSLQKFRNVQSKCSILGINTLKQNSKMSLRYLKFHLQQLPANKNSKNSLDQNEIISQFSFSNFSKDPSFSHVFSRKEPNQQNSAKSSLNFWWAQKNFQNFQIFLSSQNKSWFGFSQNDFSFMDKVEKRQQESNFSEKGDFCVSVSQINSNSFGMETQFLWFGAVVFHLAILATIFKLPEIRTIFKFQSVLFYKVLNAFFLIIFSIYKLFKKYTKQGFEIFKVCSLSKNGARKVVDRQFSHVEPEDFSLAGLQASKGRSNQTLFFKQNFFLFSPTEKAKIKTSKNMFFDVYLRSSQFSIVLPSNFEKKFENEWKANQQNSVFHFFVPSFSRKFKVFREKRDFNRMCLTEKNTQKFDSPNFFVVPKIATFSNMPTLSTMSPVLLPDKLFVRLSQQSLPLIIEVVSKSDPRLKHTISKTEKLISHLALSVLLLGKSAMVLTFGCVHLSSNFSSKVLDIVEMILFSIYKFLEKPAELMIEWIALIFLIEWSSDIATFVPDTLDISLSKSSQKSTRSLRMGSLILSFLSFKHSNLPLSFSTISNFGSTLTVTNSLSFFTSSNLLSFVIQKRIWYFLENFSALLIQPDIDILVRQRKGMIFWDIWAEILLKAAEKYNVNIPSFVTLKEEQELFIEKLLQDRKFLTNLTLQTSEKRGVFFDFEKLGSYQKMFSIQKKSFQAARLEKKESFNGEFLSQNSLASFIENFLGKECPVEFANLSFQQKIRELAIARVFLSPSFVFPLNSSNTFMMNSSKTPHSKHLRRTLAKTHILSTNFAANSSGSIDFSSNLDRWVCNQYGTYQGPETDLFVDIHPPKSLKHIHFLKYYEPAHYTLGSLICQMYSGLFSKQVSKNILVIGSPGTAKTLFIQALAGETEMKIITDNAYRYSMVQRGVAVGMKYLRDVFDAIALQTPCLFLMEHIHVIGAKRPLLISDDENVKGIQSSFGLEQQEVHETNQMIYQLSRHAIADYKRPYKGDFSMGIPTNIFVQNLYAKAEKNSISIFQNSQFSEGGVNSMLRNFPSSPLPVDSIEHSLQQQGFAQRERVDFQNSSFQHQKLKFQSRLQISKEQIFAPPATSPFTVLMMKEQKKLKPKKIVHESSWGGLSTDQLVSYQKESYSVRAKVALLADITMNLCRGKLDMITDLLVIIDSVRSNRGFVVFATTHLPALLDPALRRPGRFDETISLAQSPNFLNRFEILKMNFEKSLSTLDFIDSSLATENFSELNLLSLITRTKLSFFHQYKYTDFESSRGNSTNSSFKNQRRIVSQISPAKAFQSFLKSSFFHDLYRTKAVSRTMQKNSTLHLAEPENNQKQNMELSSLFLSRGSEPLRRTKITKLNFKNSFRLLRTPHLFRYTFLPQGPSHVLSLSYSKVGLFLGQSYFVQNPTIYAPISLDITTSSSFFQPTATELGGNSFYNSQKQQKLQLMSFFSGKVAEFFIQKNKRISSKKLSLHSTVSPPKNDSNVFESPSGLFEKKFILFKHQKEKKNQGVQTIPTNRSSTSSDVRRAEMEKVLEKQNQQKRELASCSELSSTKRGPNFMKDNFFWTAFGEDQTWRSATPFLFSLIQKRFLSKKNILFSKMLFVDNRNPRKQPPNPPSSSILMPSKKYENFKRTENDFVQKPRFSINEKIQMHQQQRFLKELYNIPTQEFFRSELAGRRQTFFSSSFQELAYLDSLTRRLSSSHFYQRKYLGIRHRFSNINQWWNGLLPEHNTEATYLSDVDWRTMFVSIAREKQKQRNLQGIQQSQLIPDKFSKQTLEFTMDFPDSEQYYNPRNRRWYFNSKIFETFNKDSTYCLTFDTNLQYEIYYHFLMQTFHHTFHYFNSQREMLDYFVFSLLKKGFLKELDVLTTISRFQKG
jgi:SpoVK/Ycf46/Vps4 family AAA+-type ATPase